MKENKPKYINIPIREVYSSNSVDIIMELEKEYPDYEFHSFCNEVYTTSTYYYAIMKLKNIREEKLKRILNEKI